MMARREPSLDGHRIGIHGNVHAADRTAEDEHGDGRQRHVGGQRHHQQAEAAAEPNQRSTLRDPCLEMRWPHQVIAVTAPAPNKRISRPSVNFEVSSRVRNTGICGAQLPVRKPLARNMPATAHRPRMAVAVAVMTSIERGS